MTGIKMDLNDVDFDAYLANDRTLDDPEVIRVERGGRVRLRIINGAASTNFHVDLGTLQGTVATVDGDAVQPLTGSRFGLAMAQQFDILVDLPKREGVWPVLALREGERQQTGVILATAGTNVRKVSGTASAEEKLLRTQLGGEYHAYCARTSRRIPGIYWGGQATAERRVWFEMRPSQRAAGGQRRLAGRGAKSRHRSMTTDIGRRLAGRLVCLNLRSVHAGYDMAHKPNFPDRLTIRFEYK
jgi:hypothetical protein